MNTHKTTRIKPAGWLAIAVLVVLIVSALGLLIRPLTVQPQPAAEVIGPVATRTLQPVRREPPGTPLPEGWSMKTEQISGKTYFAPPADVETQIREAFDAVFACYYAEDADDAALTQQPDKDTLCASARQHSTPDFATRIELSTFREIDALGPTNPVRCTGMTTCTVARAKLEVKGVLLFDATGCQKAGLSAPCIYRGEVKGSTPYQLHIAMVELQEDGTWKIVNWVTERLPEPPPSP